VACRGLRAQERPGEIHAKDVRPRLERELFGAGNAADAGIVDQGVEPSVGSERQVEQAGNVLGVRHIRHCGGRRMTARPQAGCCVPSQVAVAIGDHDCGAL
jgi:hypothetical protein